MATDLFTPPDTKTQLARFSPTDAAIAALADEYLPLKIDGVKDTPGYKLVHQARMDIRGKRVAVERLRKELKADALSYGRSVDGEAKRLTALLAPIEAHLLEQEQAVDDEKERIKNEQWLKEEAEKKAKAEAEAAEAKRIADAEAARIKAEQDAENERLRVEREKLEAERARVAAEQKAAQEKLDAERLAHEQKMKAERQAIQDETNRLASIEAKRVQAKELEKANAEAAERAQKETVARMAREAEEVAAKVKAEEDARLRTEALKPDREKLLSVAHAVDELTVPGVSAEAEDARDKVSCVLTVSAQNIRVIAEGEF